MLAGLLMTEQALLPWLSTEVEAYEAATAAAFMIGSGVDTYI